LPDGKKTSAEEKDYDPGLEEGWPLATHVSSFDPEPIAGRKPPALLAFDVRDRMAIGCSEPDDSDVVFRTFLCALGDGNGLDSWRSGEQLSSGLPQAPPFVGPITVASLWELEAYFLPLVATEANGCSGRETSSIGTIRDESNWAGGGSSSETADESLKNCWRCDALGGGRETTVETVGCEGASPVGA
jgi:hypothetical protein